MQLNKLLIIQCSEAYTVWQQHRVARALYMVGFQIFYLTYVHLEFSSQLNLCLINNKFNYLAH